MAIPSVVLLGFTYQLINMNALLVLVIISMVVGGVLEIISVRQGKKDKFYIWEYSKKTTLGKKWFGVAVEDMVLFLILTPVFSITAWEALKEITTISKTPLWQTFLVGVFLVTGIYSLTYKLTKPR